MVPQHVRPLRPKRPQALQTGQDLYDTLLAEMPEAPGELVVLPHFTITGPPGFIQDSSGVIVGLKLETTRGEILKGILEAATFYLARMLCNPARGGY